MPCARATRPTTAMSSQLGDIARPSPSALRRVANLQGDRLALFFARRRRQRPEGGSGPTLLADDASELPAAHEQLDERGSALLRLPDAHLVWPVCQGPRQHL